VYSKHSENNQGVFLHPQERKSTPRRNLNSYFKISNIWYTNSMKVKAFYGKVGVANEGK